MLASELVLRTMQKNGTRECLGSVADFFQPGSGESVDPEQKKKLGLLEVPNREKYMKG
jgi:hypothetical protein